MFTFCHYWVLFQKWDNAYGSLDSWSCGLRPCIEVYGGFDLRSGTCNVATGNLHVATGFRRSSVRSGTDSAKCVGCGMKVVSGDHDPKHISTRYLERQNLRTRMAVTAPEGKPEDQPQEFHGPLPYLP